jgi:hypothetical protein
MPAPAKGLRVTPLGAEGAVVVLPVTHARAIDPTIALERLAPERLVLLPREANPAFHNAIVALCHRAGLSPTFVEMSEPRVEHVLYAPKAPDASATVAYFVVAETLTNAVKLPSQPEPTAAA